MGLLDGIKDRVSSAVTSVKSTVTETVQKVEDKAAATGHAVSSAFESKPPPPSVPTAPPAESAAPPVPANSFRNGVTSSILDSIKSKPATPAQAEAQAMIDRNKSWKGLDDHKLAEEMAALVKKDPTKADVLKEVINKVGWAKNDDVSRAFASKLTDEELRSMSLSPRGREALGAMTNALKSGSISGEDQLALNKLSRAEFEAGKASDVEKAKVAGGETYLVNGNKVADLNDFEQVKQLIANSPQLDADTTTTRDDNRCGGAALLNGMLIDGNYAANASAIEARLAKGDINVATTDRQREALAHMKSGKMTANDAAQLQDLLFKMASASRPGDPNLAWRTTPGNGWGVTPQALDQLVDELKANGALKSGTRIVSGNEHFTVETKRDGITYAADSWPNPNGQASVKPLGHRDAVKPE
ncbi:MAG: hypothetical protein JNM17_15555 [Archangium sp.]|nr:hypothetical protein [Archangium sp.]